MLPGPYRFPGWVEVDGFSIGSSGGGMCFGSGMPWQCATLCRTPKASTMRHTFSGVYSSTPPLTCLDSASTPSIGQLPSPPLPEVGNGGHCTSSLGRCWVSERGQHPRSQGVTIVPWSQMKEEYNM